MTKQNQFDQCNLHGVNILRKTKKNLKLFLFSVSEILWIGFF